MPWLPDASTSGMSNRGPASISAAPLGADRWKCHHLLIMSFAPRGGGQKSRGHQARTGHLGTRIFSLNSETFFVSLASLLEARVNTKTRQDEMMSQINSGDFEIRREIRGGGGSQPDAAIERQWL